MEHTSETGQLRALPRAKSTWMHWMTALVLALIAGGLASCANPDAQSVAPVAFTPSTRVVQFVPAAGHWTVTTIAQVQSGSEFVFNNRLYRSVEPGKAQVAPGVDVAKLFEADRQYDKTSRRPEPADVVQLLDKDGRFASHAPLSAAPPGSTIRFQGRAYTVGQDRGLTHTGMVYSSAVANLQRIEITTSGLRHVIDRHTTGGTMTAGKSVFNSGESIQALIKGAELIRPVLEANGYLKRESDAGRIIGYYLDTGKRTTSYRVITTQSGKLVTAYPIAQ